MVIIRKGFNRVKENCISWSFHIFTFFLVTVTSWNNYELTGYGTTDWFQIGKGVRQGCILSPCLFNLCAEYITRNVGLDEAQAGIKISGRNINNLRYASDTTLTAEMKRNWIASWWKWKRILKTSVLSIIMNFLRGSLPWWLRQ